MNTKSHISLDIEDIVEPNFPADPTLLLHPIIPKPLHGTNPRTIMGQKKWDVVRKEAYARNNYHCFACGIHRNDVTPRQILHAHEQYDIDYGRGKVSFRGVIALCPQCHDLIHSQRYDALFDKGEINLEDAWLLERHKEMVLQDLVREEYQGEVAKWEDWHLEIDGEKYYSKFANEKEWREFYGTKKT